MMTADQIDHGATLLDTATLPEFQAFLNVLPIDDVERKAILARIRSLVIEHDDRRAAIRYWRIRASELEQIVHLEKLSSSLLRRTESFFAVLAAKEGLDVKDTAHAKVIFVQSMNLATLFEETAASLKIKLKE